MVPDKSSVTDIMFCHFELFLALYHPTPRPPNNPENQNFEKIKKLPDILSFYT